MTKNICAFSTCDDGYAIKSALSLLTVRKWQPHLPLYLIGSSFSDTTKKFLKKHDIEYIELNLSKQFHTAWDYPVECFYIFAGPEELAKRGYAYSFYVDGDVYCNRDPLTIDLRQLKDFAGALTQRSIREILKEYDSEIAVEIFGNHHVLDEGRIQTGIVYFNNRSMAKKQFLSKIVNVYQTAIDNEIPRKGDDSLFALFRIAYPDWHYQDLGREYNVIAFKRSFGHNWREIDQEMINNAVFAHFTNHAKPWINASSFPTYTYSYFYHAWRRHAIDVLDEAELNRFFPALAATLTNKHLRFYWYPTKNVGDLITPYFLEKVCNVKSLDCYKISEEEITEIEHQQISKDIRPRLARFRKKLQKRQFRIPHKQALYGVSTGSVVRLCQDHALVYGSGIRSGDQEVHASFIRAVRGPVTRKRYIDCGYACPPTYGDPGLLLPAYYKPNKSKKYSVGVIPHFTEYKKINEQYNDVPDILVIDMGCGDLEKVIDEMNMCERTLSSSLHGLIISHAYGIPTRQVEYSDNIKGDGTKFLDYYSSVPIKRINPVQAPGYKYITPAKLKTLKYEEPLAIDTSALQDAMFFDKNGFKKSARYPFA